MNFDRKNMAIAFLYLGISMFFSHHDDENESVRYEYFHSSK